MNRIDIHGATLSRRSFLASGGALVVVAVTGGPALAQRAAPPPADPKVYTSWLEIRADNTVTIRTGKSDFGQSSIYTAYRQIVAEELSMPLSAMTEVISADTDRTPDGGGTFGLLRYARINMAKVAAYTREAVLELAAAKFSVAKAALSIKDGVISGGGKSATYGELIAGQELRLEIPLMGDLTMPGGLFVGGEPPMKPASDYTIIGQPVKNPSLGPKLTGAMPFVSDIKLPGMLHARTVHPATLGSTLVAAGKLDSAQFPGARLVVMQNLVAVVSENEWEAVQAAQQVASDTKWSEWQGLPGHDKLFDHLRSKVDWSAVEVRKGRENKGDQSVAAARELVAAYGLPYHKHAPIGPMVTLADYRADGSVMVHTSTQNAQHLRRMLALMLGTDLAKVVVRTYPGSGHYGRSNGGSAGSEDEAVLLSRELGQPVRVQWMRGDDMGWSSQSSTMVSDIRIGLNAEGKIVRYQADHRGPPMQDDRLVGALLAGKPVIPSPANGVKYGFQGIEINVGDSWVYGEVPNVQEQGHGTIQLGEKESPIGVGLRDHSMRTPIQYQQNFPREAAMSEAAALAGKDALQFRIDHTTDPRVKAVLERLRSEDGWESRPSPAPKANGKGKSAVKGRGVSFMLRDNGYWACAAHVTVVPATGAVTVERITLVADPGIVVNPLQLKRQMEAGCLMGVSQALHEEVTFDEGAITSLDWSSYPILTMAEAPPIKIVIAPWAKADIYGQGSESANALAGPAIAAAFHDATGKPARRLPLRPEHVKTMLAG